MDTNVKTETFCQRVVAAAVVRPEKIAMMAIDREGTEMISFGSMLEQIRSVAYRLTQESISFGDRVAIIGENHPNWAIAYLAIIYRGAVATPLDPAASTNALAAFLKGSETKLAFVSPNALDKFRTACEIASIAIPAVVLRPSNQSELIGQFTDWAATPVPKTFIEEPPPARASDLAVLMYTSGTTGVPKAVPLTHGNIYAESTKIQEVMRLSDKEVVLSLLPLFHAYSQIVNLWLATIIGAKVVYLTELSSTEIERGLRQSAATTLVGVPRLWYLFHKKIWDSLALRPWLDRILFHVLLVSNGFLRDWFGLNAGRVFFGSVHKSFGGKLTLAVSGGASFDVDVARDFHRLGFTILQGYGLTETCGAATVTRFEDNKLGSVGTPLKGVEIEINQPDQDGVGEVLIRGPVVMSGYYNNPEANHKAFTSEGWFRSGDLGRLDRDGHLYIVGRKKDVIKLPSGKNVFPEDVESHYERSPFVSEICVLGLKDITSEFNGAEKLCAVVVPNFDHLKAQHIGNSREWVVWDLENRGRELPEYQRVHEFVLRAEALPRTSTRKVRRFELKHQLESARQNEAIAPREDFTLATADKTSMDSVVGRAVSAAISQHAPSIKTIHPGMNLEIDLGMDSLARAECLATTQQNLHIEFKPHELPAVQTVAELIQLASAKLNEPHEKLGHSENLQFHWRDMLKGEISTLPQFAELHQRKPWVTVFAFVVLRSINVCARLLFRMKVKGDGILSELQPPYLICPNHQSYLDPFLICSIYPRTVLARIFHVGASMYFTNPVMARLARLINVLPIDPETHLLDAMRAGASGVRRGKILNIYPEGQRSFDGELLEFKKGASILASALNVPIVPVAIDGTYRIWPRESWRLRLANVSVRFGDPIHPQRVSANEEDDEAVYAKLSEMLKSRIQQMLDEMRSQESKAPSLFSSANQVAKQHENLRPS
jgi:long-chain acyl-CoA synthetase